MNSEPLSTGQGATAKGMLAARAHRGWRSHWSGPGHCPRSSTTSQRLITSRRGELLPQVRYARQGAHIERVELHQVTRPYDGPSRPLGLRPLWGPRIAAVAHADAPPGTLAEHAPAAQGRPGCARSWRPRWPAPPSRAPGRPPAWPCPSVGSARARARTASIWATVQVARRTWRGAGSSGPPGGQKVMRVHSAPASDRRSAC